MRTLGNKVKVKLRLFLKMKEIPFNKIALRGVARIDDTTTCVDKLIISLDSLELSVESIKSLINDFEEQENIVINSILLEI